MLTETLYAVFRWYIQAIHDVHGRFRPCPQMQTLVPLSFTLVEKIIMYGSFFSLVPAEPVFEHFICTVNKPFQIMSPGTKKGPSFFHRK